MDKKPHSPWLLIFACLSASCSPFSLEPQGGPDKQNIGSFTGAATGAGAGLVIAHNIGSSLGSGAAVGSGFGAVAGALTGLSVDLLEEDIMQREYQLGRTQERLWAQELLSQHYAKRLDIHPNRDIFPADLFFDADSVKLTREGTILLKELALLTRSRLPHSRIVIASYVVSKDESSKYASYITARRAEEIATEFVRAGLEPRRVSTRPMTLSQAVLLDPYDDPNRYKQAIEIIAVDN